MSTALNLGMLLLGLVGLVYGGSFLIDAASKIAKSLGIPPLIVGLTVVAVGTSMPELLVSVRAAMQGASDIALGNVIGSNIANIGLILGLSGIVTPLAIRTSLVKREIPIMIAVSVVLLFLMLDRTLSRSDGIILLVGYVAFNGFMLWSTLRRPTEEAAHDDDPSRPNGDDDNGQPINMGREVLILVVGIAILAGGAELTVRGATTLARNAGVSEMLIGITLVAVGTSLPELATSLVASFRKQLDIAVGNVVGSNIANILLILGAASTISNVNVRAPGSIGFNPYQYTAGTLTFDIPVMIGFALLMLPFALNLVLSRRESMVFMIGYIGFIAFAFLTSAPAI